MFHTGPDKEAEEETEKERENVHKHEHPRAEHAKPQDEGQLKTKQKGLPSQDSLKMSLLEMSQRLKS